MTGKSYLLIVARNSPAVITGKAEALKSPPLRVIIASALALEVNSILSAAAINLVAVSRIMSARSRCRLKKSANHVNKYLPV